MLVCPFGFAQDWGNCTAVMRVFSIGKTEAGAVSNLQSHVEGVIVSELKQCVAKRGIKNFLSHDILAKGVLNTGYTSASGNSEAWVSIMTNLEDAAIVIWPVLGYVLFSATSLISFYFARHLRRQCLCHLSILAFSSSLIGLCLVSAVLLSRSGEAFPSEALPRLGQIARQLAQVPFSEGRGFFAPELRTFPSFFEDYGGVSSELRVSSCKGESDCLFSIGRAGSRSHTHW